MYECKSFEGVAKSFVMLFPSRTLAKTRDDINFSSKRILLPYYDDLERDDDCLVFQVLIIGAFL